MNKIFKIAAAAVFTSLMAFSAQAADKAKFQGVTIVPASYSASAQDQAQPSFKRGKVVSYATEKKPGSIIVDTDTNRLYFVLGMDRAIMYRIASAKPGFEWQGTNKVSAKSIGGPIMIGQLASKTFQIGLSPFLKIITASLLVLLSNIKLFSNWIVSFFISIVPLFFGNTMSAEFLRIFFKQSKSISVCPYTEMENMQKVTKMICNLIEFLLTFFLCLKINCL